MTDDKGTDDKEFDQFLKDEEERSERESSSLLRLLDKQRQKSGHIFALKTRMGITDSYITTVPLSWVADNLLFAGDLPLFEDAVDEKSKKIEINKGTANLIQQRQPDWRRRLEMSVYLAERDNHKFPSLLVVGYQPWTYSKKNEDGKWGMDSKAIQPSVSVTSLDSKGCFLDLEDGEETRYYALDGQHRLMAIQGLQALLRDRQLPDLDENKKFKKRIVTLDDIIDLIVKRRENDGDKDVDRSEIQEILLGRMNEMIGIEIVPAVQRGETLEQSVKRLRQMFIDVNEQAQSPTKGDNIMLDDNNGFRIVAREIMVNHNLLSGEKTMKKSGQLPEKSEYYTSLVELVEITTSYLKQIEGTFATWSKPNDVFGYIRPPQEDIDDGVNTMREYFDALSELPSHKHFLQASSDNRWKLRGQPDEQDSSPAPMLVDNILFRPIAQIALAGAIGNILSRLEITDGEARKKKLREIIRMISEQEKKGMLKLRDKKSPWYGVLSGPIDGKMRRHKSYRALCIELFIYLLHGVDDDALKALQGNFRKARATETIQDEQTKEVIGGKGWSLEGENVALEDIQLPSVWRK